MRSSPRRRNAPWPGSTPTCARRTTRSGRELPPRWRPPRALEGVALSARCAPAGCRHRGPGGDQKRSGAVPTGRPRANLRIRDANESEVDDARLPVSDRRRRNDRRRGLQGDPRPRRERLDRARRRGSRSALQPAAALEGPLAGEGRGVDLARHRRPRRRPAPRPEDRRSTSAAVARPTTRATPTATSVCCSRPAAGRVAFRTTSTASPSTSASSATTAACAPSPSEGADFVVLGGGFIGSEIAAALVGVGREVTHVFPEQGSAPGSSRPASPSP